MSNLIACALENPKLSVTAAGSILHSYRDPLPSDSRDRRNEKYTCNIFPIILPLKKICTTILHACSTQVELIVSSLGINDSQPHLNHGITCSLAM